MNATIDHLRTIRPDELRPDELSSMSARITAKPREMESDGDLRLFRSSRRPLVMAGVSTAVAGAAVAAVIVGIGGSPTRHLPGDAHATKPLVGSTMKARLLAALDDASDDVVETRTVISDGQVIDRFANADNTRSVTYISGYGMEPAENSLVVYGPSGTTITDVYPATKTYVVEPPNASNPNHPIAPPSIRAQIEDGVLTVIATGQQVEGHETIELTDVNTGPTAGISHLWVDSSTYLPVREVLGLPEGVTGDSSQTEWTYYPPSNSSLAKLQLAIPSDYTQVSTPPTTLAP